MKGQLRRLVGNDRDELLRQKCLLLDSGSRNSDLGVLLGVDDALLGGERRGDGGRGEEREKER